MNAQLLKALSLFKLSLFCFLIAGCNEKETQIYLESLPTENIENDMPLTPIPVPQIEIIDINIWDMNTDGNIILNFNPDNNYIVENIIYIKAFIYRSDNVPIPFSSINGAETSPQEIRVNNTNTIQLFRANNGIFDNPTFGADGKNRGYVIITYVKTKTR